MHLFDLHLRAVLRIAMAAVCALMLCGLILPDRVANAQSSADLSGNRVVQLVVTGVEDLAAYAAVTDYLQSLETVRAVNVEQLSGGAVTYRLHILGDAGELARAIELNPRLHPASPGVDAAMSGALSYQYRP